MRLNPNMRTRQMPDKALMASILTLLIFGWLMSFSASLAYFSSYSFFFNQTVFICAGLFAGLIILNTPISTLQKYSIPLFILSLILLTVVFFPPPIGHTVNGSTRWINFVFFKFQPSELIFMVLNFDCSTGINARLCSSDKTDDVIWLFVIPQVQLPKQLDLQQDTARLIVLEVRICSTVCIYIGTFKINNCNIYLRKYKSIEQSIQIQ